MADRPGSTGTEPGGRTAQLGRRPLPAIVLLAALTLLTALVWWRVLNNGTSTGSATSCPTTAAHALPNPADVTLTVLNSTQRAGLAKSASTALTKLGFQVSGYANDIGHAAIKGVGEVRYGADQKAAADLLTFYVPGATEVALGANSEGKLVLSLGQAFRAPRTTPQAAAAMSSANVSAAPSSATTQTGC
jgi:hypothetical protein